MSFGYHQNMKFCGWPVVIENDEIFFFVNNFSCCNETEKKIVKLNWFCFVFIDVTSFPGFLLFNFQVLRFLGKTKTWREFRGYEKFVKWNGDVLVLFILTSLHFPEFFFNFSSLEFLMRYLGKNLTRFLWGLE